MKNLYIGGGFPRALHVILIRDPSLTMSPGASVVMFVSLGESGNDGKIANVTYHADQFVLGKTSKMNDVRNLDELL